MGGGSYLGNEGVSQPAVSVPSGSFSMNGGSLVKHTASNTSAPLISQSGTGGATLKNVTFGGGTGTPVGVVFGTDTAGNAISNMAMSIYTVTLPAVTVLGDYGQSVKINGAVGSQREVRFQSAGLARFLLRVSTAPERAARTPAAISRFLTVMLIMARH